MPQSLPSDLAFPPFISASQLQQHILGSFYFAMDTKSLLQAVLSTPAWRHSDWSWVPLDLPWKQWGHLATPTWLTFTWKALSEQQLRVTNTTESPYLIRLQDRLSCPMHTQQPHSTHHQPLLSIPQGLLALGSLFRRWLLSGSSAAQWPSQCVLAVFRYATGHTKASRHHQPGNFGNKFSRYKEVYRYYAKKLKKGLPEIQVKKPE